MVVRLCTGTFRLDFGTIGRWKNDGDYSTEGVSERFRKSGYKTSKYFSITLLPDNKGLLVSGVRKDLETVGRFLGR